MRDVLICIPQSTVLQNGSQNNDFVDHTLCTAVGTFLYTCMYTCVYAYRETKQESHLPLCMMYTHELCGRCFMFMCDEFKSGMHRLYMYPSVVDDFLSTAQRGLRVIAERKPPFGIVCICFARPAGKA